MNNHEAGQALASHNILVDPGDKRSLPEIAQALGVTGLASNIGSDAPKTQLRAEDMQDVVVGNRL